MRFWTVLASFLCLIVLPAAACSKMGGGAKPPHRQHAFEPPAGRYNISGKIEKGSEKLTNLGKDSEEEGGTKSEETTEKATIIPRDGGLPAALLVPGSATEAQIRAERLHRYLTVGELPNLPGKVTDVRVDEEGYLLVVLQVPPERGLVLEDLPAAAKTVSHEAMRAVPEASEPAEFLRIDVMVGEKLRARWRKSGWQFE